MRKVICKLSSLLILILLLSSCGQKRVKIGSLEEYNLKQDVWQIIEHPYEGDGTIDKYNISDIDKYNWRYPHKLYEFNEKGYLIKECDIDWDEDVNDCISQKIVGNIVVKESKENKTEIRIQENGVRAEYVDTISDGYIVEYKHNGSSNIFHVDYYGEKYTIEQKLNNNGQIVNVNKIDSLGKKHKLEDIDYNSNRDIANLKEYKKDSLIKETTYLYEYDDNNNWTQKLVFEDDVFVIAVRRNISYYEECFKDFKRTDLIGMWKRKKSENWIEFFDDGKIDIGRGSSIRESGTWEIDEKTKRLTFRIDGGGTKLDYEFSNCSLVLSGPTDKDDFAMYVKVTE